MEIQKDFRPEQIDDIELVLRARRNKYDDTDPPILEAQIVFVQNQLNHTFQLARYSRISLACTAILVMLGTDVENLKPPIRTKIKGVSIRMNGKNNPGVVIQDPDHVMPEDIANELGRYPEYGLAGFAGTPFKLLADLINNDGDRVISAEELKKTKLMKDTI